METAVTRSSVQKRLLYGLLGLVTLGLLIQKIIRRDFSTPFSIAAGVG